jgi:AcrR family transcriptional regulator
MAKTSRPAGVRSPGRPRSDASRAAILKAAYQILREGGIAEFTVEGVAARAGAGKATIYRWWNGKGPLAVEAFLVAVSPRMDAVSESTSAIADLRKQVHLAAGIYRGRVGQLLRELLALERADSETGKQLASGFLEPRRKAAFVTLRRAREVGELRSDIDLEVLADALWGPILHRVLITRATLDRKFVDKLLDLVLAGATDGAKAGATRAPAKRASRRAQSA